ncbi:MAG: hypothetical protein IIC20_00705 [Chloroflexi bacterium]|nr:hypothetical protein [Chloroflexota bacterium]
MEFAAAITLTNQDGSMDLRAVTEVANTMGLTMSSPKTVCMKSTVPVLTPISRGGKQ